MRFCNTNAYAAAPQINGSRSINRTTQMHAQSAITLHKKTRSRFWEPNSGFFRNRTRRTTGGST